MCGLNQPMREFCSNFSITRSFTLGIYIRGTHLRFAENAESSQVCVHLSKMPRRGQKCTGTRERPRSVPGLVTTVNHLKSICSLVLRLTWSSACFSGPQMKKRETLQVSVGRTLLEDTERRGQWTECYLRAFS